MTDATLTLIATVPPLDQEPMQVECDHCGGQNDSWAEHCQKQNQDWYKDCQRLGITLSILCGLMFIAGYFIGRFAT